MAANSVRRCASIAAIAIAPSGAPISYTSRLSGSDRDYFSYGLSLAGQVGPGFTVQAGVRGEVGRSDTDVLTSFGGLAFRF